MANVKRCFLMAVLVMAAFTVIGCSGGGDSGPKDLTWDQEKWDESNWK